MKRWVVLSLVAGAAAFLLIAPTWAVGGEEEEGVTAQGRCSSGSTWSLTMAREIGVVFEAEIETNAPGEQWRITVAYNHHVLLSQVEETEEDGGFEVVKVESNSAGEDIGSIRATNLETGEKCWARLRTEL